MFTKETYENKILSPPLYKKSPLKTDRIGGLRYLENGLGVCGAAGCVWTRANCGYVDSVLDGNACNTKIVYKGMGRAYRSGRREWWVSEW